MRTDLLQNAPPPQQPAILVVDDDAHMRETLQDNLEADGYEVMGAASGAEAVALAKSKIFDVILMDYNLTDSTGIQVIQQIRAFNTESQILMLTAYASLDTALKAIQESVYDFLPKPVDFAYLKHRLAKAVEKLRLEQKNRQLIAELSYLNGMKSKFMSMSSHDLSNALMTLQVSFEMLAATLTPNEEQKKRMSYISSGISQITRLTGDLVDWASIEQGRLRMEEKLADPGAVAEETVVGPQAKAQTRGISLDCRVEPNLGSVRADKRRIQQVLTNLLENALRHTPQGGQVTLAVDGQNDCVRFAVRDSGEGIAPEEVDKIFQSFYQAPGQKEQGRLGLGLSIAKEIIASHHGRIWAESPGLGKGATFFFTIPLAQAEKK